MTRDEAIKRVGCSGFNLDVLNVIESLGLIEFEKVDKRQELIKEARRRADSFQLEGKNLILRLISELEKG